MNLLLSLFITHQRDSKYNRYNRLDIFKYTLESYSQIKWDNIYLFIELDTEFLERKHELEEHIYKIFKCDNISLHFYRIIEQHIWQQFFLENYKSNEDRLIFFNQNCSHVFIDFNLDIFNEGITLLKNDISKYKSLYMSHWPEILKLSGKLNNQEYIGNYIKFKATLVDSTQIMNLNYIKFLLTELNWFNQPILRIDGLITQDNIWHRGTGNNPYNSPEYNFLQTIYVPLRELCRKFHGYDHIKIRNDELGEFPALKLPKELNNFSCTKEELIKKIYVPHFSEWTQNNSFIIPKEIGDKIIKLYEPILL